MGDTCCGYETDCKGARCVDGTCRACGVPCTDASGCFFVYDDILECVEGTCRQVFGLRCAGNSDCDPAGSGYVHCVTGVGRCAMGPG